MLELRGYAYTTEGLGFLVGHMEGYTLCTEAGDMLTEWPCWRKELELTQGNWDAVSIAASNALWLHLNLADMLTMRGLVLFLVTNCQARCRTQCLHAAWTRTMCT